MTGGKRRVRLFAQLACFATAVALLLPLPPLKEAKEFVVQLSPFLAISSSIALRSLGVGSGIGLLLGVIAIWQPRWFCRYACPVGLLVEAASRFGLRKTSWWGRCPQVGQAIVLLTVSGAIVGYPILLWLDPLAFFSGFLTIGFAAGVASGILSGVLLVLVLVLSLTSGALWCARLCPLGATQDLLALGKKAVSKKQKDLSGRSSEVSAASRHVHTARRAFLLGAAGLGLGLWARRIGAARGENAPLRPPGAVKEERFAGLCVRCGNCIRACPPKVIHTDMGDAGIAGLLAPIIRYESSYCLESCNACTQVCPSGTLQPLDLERKKRHRIGEALVDGSTCLVVLGKKDCDACVRACPFGAVRIHWDEERYAAWPAIDAAKCNGCGACEIACPTEPIKAIRVWKSAS